METNYIRDKADELLFFFSRKDMLTHLMRYLDEKLFGCWKAESDFNSFFVSFSNQTDARFFMMDFITNEIVVSSRHSEEKYFVVFDRFLESSVLEGVYTLNICEFGRVINEAVTFADKSLHSRSK